MLLSRSPERLREVPAEHTALSDRALAWSLRRHYLGFLEAYLGPGLSSVLCVQHLEVRSTGGSPWRRAPVCQALE